MPNNGKSARRRSEVAMRHELSGQLGDVTGDGIVVYTDAGQHLQSTKQLLSGEVEHLSDVWDDPWFQLCQNHGLQRSFRCERPEYPRVACAWALGIFLCF